MALPIGATVRWGTERTAPDHKADRRQSTREATKSLCELIAANGNPICSCLIHNLSSSGAMLEISTQDVPSQFVLFDHQHRFKVASKIVWHCGNLVGVEFVTKPREI